MFKPFQTAFMLFLGGLLVLYVSIDGVFSPLYDSLHFIIILLGVIHIARARGFNLGISFSFFAVFLFGFIPLFEHKLGITYQEATIPRESSYLAAAGFALLSSICFYAGYSFRRAIPARLQVFHALYFANKRQRQLCTLFAITAILILAIAIVAYHELEIRALLFRGESEELDSTASSYSLINYFARPLLFNLIVIVVLARRNRRSKLDLTSYLLLACVTLLVSPLGIPRSLAGALYVPLLVLVFFPKLASKYGMLSIITAATLIAAPVADLFRRVLQPGDSIDFASNFNLEYFFAGHFDAFHNLAQVVELDYSSGGWQIAGALLFWIPRALWPGKPVGTSFDFSEFAGWRAGNISFSLTGELYVDFGVIGIAVGMLLLGVIYKSFDNFLTAPRPVGSLSSYIYTIAQLELAILGVYLLRGSFLSSFAYTIGVASTFVVIRICSKSIAGNDGRKRRLAFASNEKASQSTGDKHKVDGFVQSRST